LKIFVSYSRRDADFAQQVYDYFEESEHVIFTDVNNIQIGDIWSDIIKDNISKCDVFAIIVIFASIRSKDVEKEVLQAQKENKIIIPCIHKDVGIENLKWDLDRYQGFEFDDRYDLARKLYSKIAKRKIPISSKNSIDLLQAKDKDKEDNNTLVLKDENSAEPSYSSIKADTSSEKIPPSLNKQLYPSASPLSYINKIQQQNNDNIYSDQNTLDQPKPQTPSLNVDTAVNNDAVTNNNNKSVKVEVVAKSYSFLRKFGRGSIDDGQLYYPQGVAVDSQGYVYVADTINDRIQKFDSNGTFISKWGSLGSSDGRFFYPNRIAVDSQGYVYVADTGNNRIQKFNSNGKFITKWGSKGSADDGQFDYPNGIAVDSTGKVYVADWDNHRIQVFSSSIN
jgi:hypothetical protein